MSWPDTVFKFLSLARYTSITPTLAEGEAGELRLDSTGRLLVAPQPTNTLWQDSGPSVAERVVKGSAGRLFQIFGRNTGGSVAYVFIFNATARPANGSTAHLFTPIKVAPGDHFSIELERPRAFSQGLFWSSSSTDGAFTYASGASFAVTTEYD